MDADSIGKRLLNALRGRGDERGVASQELPAAPSAAQLRQAVLAARSGRSDDCEHLSLLLLAADRERSAEVVGAAEELLGTAEPRLWLDLDQAGRRSWWHAPTWAEPARVAAGDANLLGVVVASFHPSGYVREAATARLGELNDPLALPALALRAGDWVPQVRARARVALEHRLSSVAALLEVGPLAIALAARVHGSWLMDRLESSMAALTDADLARLRAATDWRVRRTAYNLALSGGRLGLEELILAAERDGDLVIRTRCADAAIRAASAAGAPARVRRLTHSGTAAVRASAVAALARSGDTGTAVAALPDRNPAVREAAQTAVRRSGGDPAAAYRTLLRADGVPDPGAVAGLGETGTPEDVHLIRASLGHPLPRGRAEAVRALRRLGAVDIETMLGMLRDPSAAVARQAALALRPCAASIPADRLEELLDHGEALHVRGAAYRVLREHDVWARILIDLELYDDASENLRRRARGDLAGWLDRDAATTYSMPRGATADRLDGLLVRHASTLGRDRERLLRFHLGLTSRAAP